MRKPLRACAEFLGERPTAACSLVAASVFFILMMSLLIASFSKCPVLHVGIDYNTHTNSVDRTRVYAPGRYILGIGHRFITFPTTATLVDFTNDPGPRSGSELVVSTQDGQLVTIEASFFYRIIPNEVLSVFDVYGERVHDVVVLAGLAAIKNTAARFVTTDYFVSRRLIGAAMLAELQRTLRPHSINVTGFSLREIALREQFNEAFIATVVANQAQQTAALNQTISLVNADIVVLNARADALIKVIYAESNRQGSIIITESASQALSITVGAEALAMQLIMGQMNFNSTHVLQYVWMRVMRDAPSSASYLIGVADKATRINLP